MCATATSRRSGWCSSARWSGWRSIDPPVASGVARISHRGGRGRSASSSCLHLGDARLRPRRHAGADLASADRLGDRGAASPSRDSSTTISCRPALIGGLVLIVMLIGFTVMQHAFAGGAFAHGSINDTERRALALSGAGDIVFDWDVVVRPDLCQPRDRAPARTAARRARGPGLRLARPDPSLRPGSLPRGARRRDRAAPRPHRAGFPPARTPDAHHWFRLKARPVIGTRRRGHPHRRHACPT